MDVDEYRFQTAGGLAVRVRSERPEDAVHLVRLFSGLSPDSRFLRFSKALQDPSPELVRREAERLAGLEPPVDFAWLAFADLPGAPDEPVAGARYVRMQDDPTSAEVAISVRDDVQRQGIGSTLLGFMAEHARQHGMRRLVATFRSENRAVWALLRRSPYRVIWDVDGSEVRAAIDLTATNGQL
jgi:RimJ/RimL family protein N-acetyltransferase